MNKPALVLHLEARCNITQFSFIDIARRQRAKSWELRAATSLARLWQSQGKRQDAYELLAPGVRLVYGGV